MEQNMPQATNAQPGPANPPNPLANYKFSQEELRVLKECNRESFYFRSLPIGTALGTLAYYAVKQGYLKPSAKLGAIPKVIGAVGVGYFIGKVSYQNQCMEKIMALPNSKLAEVLRQRKGRGSPHEDMMQIEGAYASSAATETFEKPHSSESYQELKALDLTFDAPPSAVGLDDSSRPSVDSVITDDMLPPPVQSQNYVSYEERRRMNREEFEKKKLGKPVPPPQQPTGGYSEEATSRMPQPAPSYMKPVNKNAYGDVWEE